MSAIGYWAKLAVGKAPARRSLPPAEPGRPRQWMRGDELLEPARPTPRAPTRSRRPARTVPPRRAGLHPLVRGAKPLFEAGRLSRDAGYLKPAKRLLVDLAVTRTGLDRALSFANELFVSLEARGHRVVIAPRSERLCRGEVDVREALGRNERQNHTGLWSPWRCTVAYVDTVAIGLTVIETCEQAEARYVDSRYVRLSDEPGSRARTSARWADGWVVKSDFPTGRLRLQAYSPYYRARWSQSWQETGRRDLEKQIPSIVRELESAVTGIARLVEEGDRQAEIERRKWDEAAERRRREEEERLAAKRLKDSRDELLSIVDDWATARRIREFLDDAERAMQALPDAQRRPVEERLRRARASVADIEPLERLREWRPPDER